MLQGLGFNNVQVQYVPSPYRGLILDLFVDGRQVEPGTKLLPSVAITLNVGDGNDAPVDSVSNEDENFVDPYADDSDGIFL